jgi:hypothetical protein
MRISVFRKSFQGAALLLPLFLGACIKDEVSSDSLLTPQSGNEAGAKKSEVAGIVRMVGPDGDTVNFEYVVKDGLRIAEGDIVLGKESDTVKGLGKVSSLGVTLATSRWTANTIPYTFGAGISSDVRTRIEQAIILWNQEAPITYSPRNGQADFVEFRMTPSTCDANIGRMGNMQIVNISANNCGATGVVDAGSILHEMAHVAGLYHEQCRADRGSYLVGVPGGLNYDIPTSNASIYGTNFDYTSIMLYNFGITRRTIDPSTATFYYINQTRFSNLDLQGLYALYGVAGPYWRYRGTRMGDFNGDGKSDRFFTWGNGVISINLTTSSGSMGATTTWANPWGHMDSHGEYQIGDFNGDGKDDILFVEPGNNSVHVALSTGSAFGASGSGQWILPNSFGHLSGGGQYRVGDFNGDGKDDLYFFEPINTTHYVALSNGTGFISIKVWVPSNGFGTTAWGGEYRVGDFNGDGKQDLLYLEPTSRRLHVCLSTGSAFGASGSGSWFQSVSSTNYFDPAGNIKNLYVADRNGDGKDDIAFFNGTQMIGLTSTGTSFSYSGALNNPNTYGNTLGFFLTGRINPDTREDLLYFNPTNNSWDLVTANTSGQWLETNRTANWIGSNGFGAYNALSLHL